MVLNDLIFTFSEDVITQANNYSYGRKVDMIMTTSYEQTIYEMSANEWKRSSCYMYRLEWVNHVFVAKLTKPLSIPKDEGQFKFFWQALKNPFAWKVNIFYTTIVLSDHCINSWFYFLS